MEQQSHQKHIRLLIYSALCLMALGSIFLFLKIIPYLGWFWVVFKAVLTPLVIAVILAYLLNPIVTLLHQRNVPRGIAVILIYFTFSLLLAVFLVNAVPAFLKQSKDLTEHIPDLIKTYQGWMYEVQDHKHDLPESMRISVDQALINADKKTSAFFTELLTGASGILSGMIHFLVIPFLVFYLLKDMNMLQKGILLLVPREKRKEFAKLFADIDEALGNYIAGQLMVCFIVGVLAYIGYRLIDMPYALILALVITVTNIIPYFGPMIGAAPSILVALTISWKITLWVIAVNLVVQILEGNLISPWVMGKRLHLHPILIIFALLVGGEAGGLLGLIFAVPIVAVLRVIFHHVILHMVKH